MKKPPAFQFYAKDWRSSPKVRMMSRAERGDYIDILAAMWDSDEPGTLPMPVEAAARCAGLDVRLLRHFLIKWPTSFEEIDGKLVCIKLRENWLNYKEIQEKRVMAGQKSASTRAQHVLNPAPAPAPASLIKSKSESIIEKAEELLEPSKTDDDADQKAEDQGIKAAGGFSCLLNIDGQRIRKADTFGWKYFERSWEEFGKPTGKYLAEFLDQKIHWCSKNGVRYPSILLKRLKELRKDDNQGFKPISEIMPGVPRA